MSHFDFANLLFSGPCNACCPTCIGKQIDPRLNTNNLDEYPPRNLERFKQMMEKYAIRQLVFTGTNTDPQLYRDEERLLDDLRQRLPPETRFSLHTNGRLAVQKMAIFNQYDQVTLSFPSFNPDTYRRMMGVPGLPDLPVIMSKSRVPVKVSCLVSVANAPAIDDFLLHCQEIGVRRVVLRKLYGERRTWENMVNRFPLEFRYTGLYRKNPVYDYQGMEVTLWDFDRTDSTSINLFSTGFISTSYLLARPA